MVKHTDIAKKSEILTLSKAGKTVREISVLANVSRSTVSFVLTNYKKRKSLERKVGSGRPKIMSSAISELISTAVNKNPRISTVKLVTEIQTKLGILLSRKTIFNYLKGLGYMFAVAAKKPLLKFDQKIKRLNIAEEWIFWPQTKWHMIIFSDESKFNLIGSDGVIKIWRKKSERLKNNNVIKTVKFGGGSIMVWGCFSVKGVGNLVLIDRIMDRFVYVDILSNNLFDSAQKMGLNDFFFQQDNDPKHKSKLATEFFRRNHIPVIDWPSQSPDLNPIENIWAYLERKINKKIIKSKDQLFECLIEEWIKIPITMLENLVESMKYRAKDVILAKGGHIDY